MKAVIRAQVERISDGPDSGKSVPSRSKKSALLTHCTIFVVVGNFRYRLDRHENSAKKSRSVRNWAAGVKLNVIRYTCVCMCTLTMLLFAGKTHQFNLLIYYCIIVQS